MRNKEMAFTSFEFLDDKATGNWVFGDEAIPDYYLYNVQYGIGNMAVVEASIEDLQDVEKVDVTARRGSMDSLSSGLITIYRTTRSSACSLTRSTPSGPLLY